MSKEKNLLTVNLCQKYSLKSATTALAFILSMSASTAVFADDKAVTKLPTVIVREKEDRKDEGYQATTTNTNLHL
jgi:hypothetical protein